MPFDPGASIPDPALQGVAEDADMMMGDALASLIPPPMRPYNPKVVTSLANALADVLALFDMAVEPETYTGPQESLDPDLVRFLSMVATAAEDYGKRLPIRLEEMRDEAALTRTTAALTELANDAEFKAFLEEPSEEVDEAQVEVEVTAAPPEEVEAFDFASRMRR